jgi:hypothetical protein
MRFLKQSEDPSNETHFVTIDEDQEDEMEDEEELDENVVSCVNDTKTTLYMNMPEVRKALHIPDHLPDWQICRYEFPQYAIWHAV